MARGYQIEIKEDGLRAVSKLCPPGKPEQLRSASTSTRRAGGGDPRSTLRRFVAAKKLQERCGLVLTRTAEGKTAEGKEERSSVERRL